MHRLVANDQADQIGGVGQLGPARPVHGQVKAGIEQERLQKHAGDLFQQRIVAAIVRQNDAGFFLQRGVFLTPTVSLIDIPGLA
ncbi:hypothetical protein D3C76_1704340 [compost metagenome]